MSLRDEFLKATDTPEATARALHGAEMEMRRLDEKIAELEAQLAAERALSKRMREAMTAARNQFRFYESEYLKVGMTAQAATNAGHAYRLDRLLRGETE